MNRSSAVLLLLACCVSAAGSSGPRDCPSVTQSLCDDLDRQLTEGRRQFEEVGGGGEISLKLPVAGISAGGDGTSITQSVALSKEKIDKLLNAVSACSAAWRTPSALTIEGFWKTFGQAVDDDWTCVAPQSVVVPVPQPEPARASVPKPQQKVDHLLLDLDLGVPAGVRVGYDFGNNSGHGIGVRAGVGPAWFSSSLLVGVLVGAFGEIGLGGEGRWRIEPTAGIGIVSSSVGFLGGLNVHYQTPRRAGSSMAVPAIGVRAGADVGVVSSSVVVMPDASLVLSW